MKYDRKIQHHEINGSSSKATRLVLIFRGKVGIYQKVSQRPGNARYFSLPCLMEVLMYAKSSPSSVFTFVTTRSDNTISLELPLKWFLNDPAFIIKYIIQSIVHHYDYHHIMTIHKLTASGSQNDVLLNMLLYYYVIGFVLPCNLPHHLMAAKKIRSIWLNFFCNLINNVKLKAVKWTIIRKCKCASCKKWNKRKTVDLKFGIHA